LTRINDRKAGGFSGMEEGRKRSVGRRSNRFFLLPILILLFIGASLFYVWSRIQVIQVGYEISNALKEERALADANQRLRLEIATLKSYARVEKFAVEELKMAKPRPDQVVVIR
jgi:cell division protein FtsL